MPRERAYQTVNSGAKDSGGVLSLSEAASTMRLSPENISGLRLMFHGSMVALVTPMNEDGSLDLPALRRLVEFHAENGTDAIVAVGTTGESPTLDMDEHCEVIRRTVEYARGKMPVIAGTGANSTSEAIELTRCAEQSGAEAFEFHRHLVELPEIEPALSAGRKSEGGCTDGTP